MHGHHDKCFPRSFVVSLKRVQTFIATRVCNKCPSNSPKVTTKRVPSYRRSFKSSQTRCTTRFTCLKKTIGDACRCFHSDAFRLLHHQRRLGRFVKLFAHKRNDCLPTGVVDLTHNASDAFRRPPQACQRFA